MSSILQTDFWAELKQNQGWTNHHLFGFNVLEKTLPLGASFLYIPEVMVPEGESLSAITAKAISALNKSKNDNCIFGRVEILHSYSEAADHTIKTAGLIKAKDEVQPEWRQVIDLSGSLDQIKAQMKPKGRYNIGIALKHGVEIEEDDSMEAMVSFCQLMERTAARQSFKSRNPKYYKGLIDTLKSNHVGGLWIARYKGDVLAGAIVSFYGGRASYLYGASSEKNRQVMAPYLMHFTLMAEAKKRDCRVYDMIGVAPVAAANNHPWAGISRFKREFGGATIHYLGSYDRVYRPMFYKIYQMMRGRNK